MRSWVKRASLMIVLAIAACNSTPVYNVERSAFTAPEALSNKQAVEAILSAGDKLGWNMAEIRPGHIRGDLQVSKHSATVDIKYDGRGYSIVHVNSNNLKYDSEKGSIHKTYNSWIENLERQIKAESGIV
ncbi:MAG: hypothetical protein ACR2Q4_11565 [Geminicoccaceae bacterium]